SVKTDYEVRQALCRELEEARYDASLAARRYEVVDPTKRLVARELEARWNAALECVAGLEDRIARHDDTVARRPKADRAALMALAHDLPFTWNAPGTDARTKQRIAHILIREVVLDRDGSANQAIVTIHWNGGRHTELRVSRTGAGRYPADRHPGPMEVIRKLGGQWPDREVAVTMNRMRCKPADGQAWTTVRVREFRERLGIAPFDPTLPRAETISAEEAATRLGICVRSVHKLIRRGVLPATQLMHSAPWQIRVAARLLRSRRAAGLCRPRRHRHQAGRIGAAMAPPATACYQQDATRGAAAAHQPFRIALGPQPGPLGEARAGRRSEVSHLDRR